MPCWVSCGGNCSTSAENCRRLEPLGSPVGKLLPGTWDITNAPRLTNPLRLETVGNNPSSEDIKDVINHYSCYKFVRTPKWSPLMSPQIPGNTVDILGMCLTDFLSSRSFQILRRQRSSTLTCQRWSSQLCAVGQTHWEGGLGRGVKRAASRCCAKWMEMADYCIWIIWDMILQQRWTMCWGHAPCLWHKYERARFCSVIAVVADERRPGSNYIWNIPLWISCISHWSNFSGWTISPFVCAILYQGRRWDVFLEAISAKGAESDAPITVK